MSQSDFGTINPNTKSGTDLATDLNDFRDALNSSHSGTSRPSYAQAGTVWTDTTGNPVIWYYFDGTDDIKIGEFDTSANTFVGETDLLTTANTFTKTQTWTKGSDVASASALTLGDGNYFDVTGTTAITSIGTKGVGTVIKLHFDGALTLTHHATDLILPGGANITTAAGDEFEFTEYATGDWRCTAYALASGEAIINNAASVFTESFESSQQTITAAGSLTLAHGLSSTPKLYQAVLQCTTADQNYSIGDEVSVSINMDQAAANRGVAVWPDSTNLNIRFGSASNTFAILDKTGGTSGAITNSSWRLVVRAWA